MAAERARGMCREAFYLAALILPNLPQCIIFSLLETNFHFQHSSFRRDLGFTRPSGGVTLTDISLTQVLNQISHTAFLQRLIFVSVLAARNWGEPAGGRREIPGAKESQSLITWFPVGCPLGISV